MTYKATGGPFVAYLGIYTTFAEIPAATGYQPGTMAYAQDCGTVYSDGSAWHPSHSSAVYAAGNTSTTPAPDCSKGLTQSWTQNASVTWGAPTNTTGLNVGDVLTLAVTKDANGTARTTAWNATYRDAPTIASTSTSGAKGTWNFMWDGTNWQYVGGSTAFA